MAVALRDLGLVFEDKGNLPEAEQRITEALSMQRRVHGANESVAVKLRELGVAYKKGGYLQAAKQHLTEALNMHKCIHGDSANEEVAVTLQELGHGLPGEGRLASSRAAPHGSPEHAKTHSWR